jgi:hypothetical protein
MPTLDALIRRMRLWLRLVLVLFLLALPPIRANASSVIPIDLEQTMRLAGVAFAGTVHKIESTRLPGGPVTRVTFRDLRMLKGEPRQEITITMTGGTVNGVTTFVIDQPTFSLSGRYVIFAYESLGSPADDYSPLVGLYQGFFPIETGPGGRRSVRDWLGREIVGIRDKHLLVLGSVENTVAITARPQKVEGGDTEEEFKKPRVDTRGPGMRSRTMHTVPKVASNPAPESGVTNRSSANTKVAEQNARLLSENRTPLEVIDPRNDPGTRMSEEDFLGALAPFVDAR